MITRTKAFRNAALKAAGSTKNPRTVQVAKGGSHRQGRLPSTLTVADITKRLGFKPMLGSPDGKCAYTWSFKFDGVLCAVWDYRGARWSAGGPAPMLLALFPEYVED